MHGVVGLLEPLMAALTTRERMILVDEVGRAVPSLSHHGDGHGVPRIKPVLCLEALYLI